MQLAKPKQTYHKGGATFVVPDEKIIRSKYLIVIPHKSKPIDKIQEYFMNKRASEIQAAIREMPFITRKRVNNEYKMLIKDHNVELIDNIMNITLDYQTLSTPAQKCIISLTFDDYPTHPPSVFMKNFRLNDGAGNKLLMPELTSEGWSAAMNIRQLVILINKLLDKSKITLVNNIIISSGDHVKF